MPKKKPKTRSRKASKKTLATILIVAAIVAVLVFISGNGNTPGLGTIISFGQAEYKIPVGGTITVSYTINTWNGVEYNWADLDKYQYDYKIVDEDTGRVIKNGAPWRLIHSMDDSISLVMEKEGTFNYRLEETVTFLQQGTTTKGDTKRFKIIVGSGISPTPTATQAQPVPTGTASPTPTGTIIIEQSPSTPAPTVVATAIPRITYEPYIPTPSQTPVLTPKITTTPEPTAISTPRPSAYTITPTSTTPTATPTTIPQEETGQPAQPQQTEVPAATPAVPSADGFEAVISAIVLVVSTILRKRGHGGA